MHKCTMVLKCRNDLAPPYLIDSFYANNFNYSYSTRNSSKLRIPIARTEYYHRSFLLSGYNAWNEVVQHLKDNALLWSSIWISCGKPSRGIVAQIMR